jgi:DNA invertase Pin-like site-specific DNA recombinase
MIVGYARVSTSDQTFDLQKDALTRAGCERIFTDTMSGARAERPGLVQAFTFTRAGDILVVWKLDRLGRSLRNLIDVVTELETLGIGFRSVTESIDTTTSGGKLIFHIFGALAEFERDLIRERTQAGLAAARARGRKGGRPRVSGLNDARKVAMARTLYNDKSTPIRDICRTLNCFARDPLPLSCCRPSARRPCIASYIRQYSCMVDLAPSGAIVVSPKAKNP